MNAATLEQATHLCLSTKELGKGTVLGLSMTHGLAQQFGGTLRLPSAPRQATRAKLWLPVATVGAGSESARALDAAPVSGALRILFVDDDALIAMSSVDLLEDLPPGDRGVLGVGGAEGDRKRRADRPANHQFLNAADEWRRISPRRAQAAPGLPIHLATGYAELPEGDALETPCLAKPYMQRQIAEGIARFGL